MGASKPFWEQPESRRLEFKETLPKGDQLAKTVVAFANGGGGKIVFGVKNSPREIAGVPEDKLFQIEERVSNIIFDMCAPAIIPEIFIQTVGGKTLLVVQIFPGSQKPYYLKSKGKQAGAVVRIGSSNRSASPEMVESLERQRKKLSFDGLPVLDLNPDSIDLRRFRKAYARATGRKIGSDQLRNLGLLSIEHDQACLTHAAVLLSDSVERRKLFPFAKIECARFKGTDTRVFLDQATIDRPIHETVELCIGFVKKNIALGAHIGEVYREERWEYPLEAVREAISNAVIHRDYSILGSDIKVAIFDDMLEITSPGPLPDTLPPEELGTGRSEIRNRVLAPIFKDLKLIEAWGTGIQRMRSEIAAYPEIELVFQEVGHAFQVQFKKTGPVEGKKASETSAAAEQVTAQVSAEVAAQVAGFCRVPRKASEIMEMLDLKHWKTFQANYLNPLLESGIIERTVPDKPRSSKQQYRLGKSGVEFLEKMR